jgi:L-fuculose-phosphate aldolase
MYNKEKEELAAICKLLYDRNLVTASDGNISMRVTPEHIVITPSRKNKGMLEPEDMIVVSINGSVVEGNSKVSSEYPMHQAIYRSRADVNAIVHTHPAYATAFALAGKNIPINYLVEAKVLLGPTALAEYATPGTTEMVDVISPYIGTVNSILLKNHGALTYGTDLIDAYNKMDVLENIAKTIILSQIIGEPKVISEENLAKLKNK